MKLDYGTSFDAVYYSFPVPLNPLTVSLMGILFDRVFLPGVYLPNPKTTDKKSIRDRLEFLVRSFDPNESFSAQREMIGTLKFVYDYGELQDIFIPTGKAGYMGVLEPETEVVTKQLEELVYGPPPPNFTPTPNMGFNQPAGADQINAPSWISYPANALIFSRKHGIPLLTDSSFLPIPQIDSPMIPKHEAESLASYLMVSSFSLVLPKMRSLTAEEVLWVREKMSDDIGIFRSAMLSAVSQIVELIGNNPTDDQLQKHAEYIAKTVILPKVDALRTQFESPSSIALKKLLDLSLEAPELILNFQKPEDLPWAVISALKSLAGKVSEGIHEYQEQHKEEQKSGLALLLKVPRQFPKK